MKSRKTITRSTSKKTTSVFQKNGLSIIFLVISLIGLIVIAIYASNPTLFASMMSFAKTPNAPIKKSAYDLRKEAEAAAKQAAKTGNTNKAPTKNTRKQEGDGGGGNGTGSCAGGCTTWCENRCEGSYYSCKCIPESGNPYGGYCSVSCTAPTTPTPTSAPTPWWWFPFFQGN